MSEETTAPPPIVSETLSLDELVIDERAQARVGLDEAVVDEYVEAWKNGAAMPNIDAVRVTEGELAGKVVVWDGFHRIAAAKKLGVEAIGVDVTTGKLSTAIDLCTSANSTHGLRRTNEDKRRAVIMAITLDKQLKRKRSDRQIAQYVGVHNSTVSEIRAELSGKKKKASKEESVRISEHEQGEGEINEVKQSLVTVDEIGRRVTNPEVQKVLSLNPEFDDVLDAIGTIGRRIKALVETPAGAELAQRAQSLSFDLKGVHDAVAFARPYTECPYGPGCTTTCNACRGRGWICREQWDRLDEAVKNQALTGIKQVSESDTSLPPEVNSSEGSGGDSVPAEVTA